MTKPEFDSSLTYTDREGKLRYVWDKYQTILRGASILDVGADQCHLKKLLDPGARYWGIGRGGQPDQELDLEITPYPFPDKSFDVVLCLDVLEHLEHSHAVFDELCRVAARYVIIALPNPLGSVWQRLLRAGEHAPGHLQKFYGLPVDPPEDRHRWFFSAVEAERFITTRAARCGWRVRQLDHERFPDSNPRWKACLRRALPRWFFVPGVDPNVVTIERTWAVLERTA